MYRLGSPARRDPKLEILRELQNKLAVATEELKLVPPRYQAKAARLIAANESVLRRCDLHLNKRITPIYSLPRFKDGILAAAKIDAESNLE